MTALWAVIAALTALVVLNAVATMALARQVGLLHLRVRPLPSTRVAYGPPVGAPLVLDGLSGSAPPGVERLLVGFISPNCGTCTALLPAFRALASELPREERLVFASDVEADRVRAHLDRYGVSLPVLSDANALRGNNVPGTPFLAVTDATGVVLAAGAVHNLEQIEYLVELGRGDRGPQLAPPPLPTPSRPATPATGA